MHLFFHFLHPTPKALQTTTKKESKEQPFLFYKRFKWAGCSATSGPLAKIKWRYQFLDQILSIWETPFCAGRWLCTLCAPTTASRIAVALQRCRGALLESSGKHIVVSKAIKSFWPPFHGGCSCDSVRKEMLQLGVGVLS